MHVGILYGDQSQRRTSPAFTYCIFYWRLYIPPGPPGRNITMEITGRGSAPAAGDACTNFHEVLNLDLSLYSTATQNTWRRGLALGNAPNARILGWRYQHVGILEPRRTFKLASPLTPNLKFAFYPTRNPNTSQWNIDCVGSQCKILALAMYISCFLC